MATPGYQVQQALNKLIESGIGTHPNPPTTQVSGTLTLSATSATPLGATTPLSEGVTLRADDDNPADVWIGKATVAVNNGMRLPPGESIPVSSDDLAKIFVKGAIGDKVHYIGG